MSKRSQVSEIGEAYINPNPNGPSTGGACYRKVLDPESGVMGWRKFIHSLYYKEPNGTLHAYQPGQDKDRDARFPALAKKLRLVLVGRAERRALHKAERKRYAAIVRARKAGAE